MVRVYHLDNVIPGVVAAVLVECHRVLLPLVPHVDEVDVDVLPVVIMTMVHAKWVTSLLVTIPDVPGKLQELATANYFVIYWSFRVERFALAIVLICGFIWITVVICRAVKPSGTQN